MGHTRDGFHGTPNFKENRANFKKLRRKFKERKMKTMSNKLLPCPFCGGEAKLTSSGADNGDNVVECTKCNYELGYYANLKMAIKAWNKRVVSANTDECCEKSCEDENATFGAYENRIMEE